MNTQDRTQDHMSKQEIKTEAENFLNLKTEDKGVHFEAEKNHGFWDITITVSSDMTSDGCTYQLRACPVCGKVQPMNMTAFKRTDPKLAEEMIEKARREQAEKYIETGRQPDKNQTVINRLEHKYLDWDNNRCETRHPPVRDRPAYQGNDPQTNRMY